MGGKKRKQDMWNVAREVDRRLETTSMDNVENDEKG